ncbi:MAG: hypothetical protein L6R19_19420 [Alphaproteobacteria bacterium]|nr:hypothetical protein [Alphaproteobacteria bacterium]
MTDDPLQNVDTRLLDEQGRRALERMVRGGRGGDGGGIEDRLAKIEQAVTDVGNAVRRVEAQLQVTETRFETLAKATDLAELKGRVSQLPTVWTMLAMIVTVVFAVFGGAIALLRFGLPH